MESAQTDEKIPEGYEEVYKQARAACPYMADRAMRNLSYGGIVPTAWEDLWAHLACKSATWAMCKEDARQAISHKGRLPRGIPPGPHAMCAANLAAPFMGDAPVADDLDYALRMTALLGPEASKWREARFKELMGFITRVKERRSALDAARSFTSAKVSSHIKLERIDLTRYAVGWPDVDLVSMIREGATITGVVPHAGIYRHADVQAAVSMDDFHASNEDWVNEVCVRPPPCHEQVEVILKKPQEEVDLGLMRGFWSRDQMDGRWGRGQWRCLVRFAVWQAGAAKYRVIDNGRTASHNMTLSTSERIHTATTESGAAMMRRLRQHVNQDLRGPWQPRSATQDMKRAFRQLAVRTADRKYQIIAVWIPERGWCFGELDALGFGLGAAVLEFNRCPEHMVAVARRWLALPVIHFYDDYRLLDVECSGGSVDKYFLHLNDMMGYFLDADKHQLPESKITFLGVQEEVCEDDSGEEVVRLFLSEDKRKLLLEEVRGPLRSKSCNSGDMAHIVGKLIHYGTTVAGRIGLGMIRPLALHAVAEDRNLSDLALVGRGNQSIHR